MPPDSHWRKKHQQLANNYIALMNQLQQYVKEFEGKLRWIPAHQEKRNSMSANLSRDDRLNNVADRAAVGPIDIEKDCKYE